jgi:hypothetical protein
MPGPGRAGIPGRGGITVLGSRLVNGLLPIRGAVAGGRGSPGRGAVGASGAAVAAGAIGSCGRAGGSGAATAGSTGAAGGSGASAGGAAAAVFFAAVFFAGASAFSIFGKADSTFATTGASTVEEGVLTYSPLALSHSMSSFDDLPMSLARADTRALATSLLRWPAVALPQGRRYFTALLIGAGSSSTHRGLSALSAIGSLCGVLRDVGGDGGDVGCPVETQRPSERPPALRHREAVAVGMQMCSASRQPAPRVRDQGSLDRDDTQQL